MATFQPVIAILENAAQEPLPAALVAVGGLVVLKFALGVSLAVCFVAANVHILCSHSHALDPTAMHLFYIIYNPQHTKHLFCIYNPIHNT